MMGLAWIAESMDKPWSRMLVEYSMQSARRRAMVALGGLGGSVMPSRLLGTVGSAVSSLNPCTMMRCLGYFLKADQELSCSSSCDGTRISLPHSFLKESQLMNCLMSPRGINIQSNALGQRQVGENWQGMKERERGIKW